jgi:hypothetical protein
LVTQTALTGVALGSTVTAAAKGGGAVATAASGAGNSLGAGTLLSKVASLATVKSLVLGVSIGSGIVATYSVATQFSDPAAEQPLAPRAGTVEQPTHKTAQAPSRQAATAQAAAPDTTDTLPTSAPASKPLGTLNAQSNPVPHPPGVSDSIRLEARQVSEARNLVRNGKGTEALRKLNEIDVTVPAGVLRQERDALRIDALYLSGRNRDAKKLATQFTQRYPESPLAARWASRAQ